MASPPVVLTGDELGDASVHVDTLRAAALAFARTHFQGRSVVNKATGWAIAFGRRGVNKTLDHSARRVHVSSVPALPALLVRAAYVCREANRDSAESRNIPWIHTFTAGLQLAGVLYRVRVVVKETNVGYRFYDHEVIEKAKSADLGTVASLPEEGATAPKPADLSAGED